MKNKTLSFEAWIDNHTSSPASVTLDGSLTPWNQGTSWNYLATPSTVVDVLANTVKRVPGVLIVQ